MFIGFIVWVVFLLKFMVDVLGICFEVFNVIGFMDIMGIVKEVGGSIKGLINLCELLGL